MWASKLKAGVYENTVNEWFSDALQANCRLVQMNGNSKRIVSPFYAVRKFRDTVSFADGYPILLIGESSLDDLNSKLENPVPMNRFRPNLVVKNAEVFAEDKWKKIRIGESVFHFVKPCARCVMTTINQENGLSGGKEPLKTLATYRLIKRAGKSKINFGQNLIAENFGGTVKIGDQIEILEVKKMIIGIVAVARNFAIGRDGKLPWHYSSDLKFFKETTSENVVVMGRKTYESIGKALPKRLNIVLSQSDSLKNKTNILVFQSKNEILSLENYLKSDIFIIGGAKTYAEFADVIERWIVTEIPENIEDADAFMPKDFLEDFEFVEKTELETDLFVKSYDRTK